MLLVRLNIELSKTLRKAREKRGLTLPLMATRLQMSPVELMEIESNPIRSPLCRLVKLLEGYGSERAIYMACTASNWKRRPTQPSPLP